MLVYDFQILVNSKGNGTENFRYLLYYWVNDCRKFQISYVISLMVIKDKVFLKDCFYKGNCWLLVKTNLKNGLYQWIFRLRGKSYQTFERSRPSHTK